MVVAKEIMTPQEVAAYLQLAPETIYRYIREGKLVASKLGRQYRIPKRNIELFLLATSTAGDTRLRVFAQTQVQEWLEEDQIGQETIAIGERLLKTLQQP